MLYHSARCVSASILLALLATALHAQAVYRIVGPDGRVTFSDKPPAAGANASLVPADNRTLAEASITNNLPFELRQIAGRYPVTLYTTDQCHPCDIGRVFLTRRGIPFVERTVNTPQDGEALKRLGSDASLPFLTIGNQRLRGFSDMEWGQFLSAAGYPAESRLPAGYRQPPVMPLVSIQKPNPSSTTPSATTPPPMPSTVNPTNPAGIVF